MTETLFVYGIFLDPRIGARYGMAYGPYAVVHGWSTKPVSPEAEIVEAVRAEGHALTGRVVRLTKDALERVDCLEAGYKRVRVATSAGLAWMYADPAVPLTDHNTVRLAWAESACAYCGSTAECPPTCERIALWGGARST